MNSNIWCCFFRLKYVGVIIIYMYIIIIIITINFYKNLFLFSSSALYITGFEIKTCGMAEVITCSEQVRVHIPDLNLWVSHRMIIYFFISSDHVREGFILVLF